MYYKIFAFFLFCLALFTLFDKIPESIVWHKLALNLLLKAAHALPIFCDSVELQEATTKWSALLSEWMKFNRSRTYSANMGFVLQKDAFIWPTTPRCIGALMFTVKSEPPVCNGTWEYGRYLEWISTLMLIVANVFNQPMLHLEAQPITDFNGSKLVSIDKLAYNLLHIFFLTEPTLRIHTRVQWWSECSLSSHL